jgi:hypothetical protein
MSSSNLSKMEDQIVMVFSSVMYEAMIIVQEEEATTAATSYSQHTLGLIMHAFIILHNMIIDDERDDGYNDNYHTVTSVVAPPINYKTPASLTSIF